ncbi:MAG: hypothetical protein LUG57_00695, partial [Oscillospiraceae bacterium]|nr:hypothetical protein [Oscillospiraceae bacterium]
MERRRIIALFGVLIIIVLALVLLLTRCGKSDDTENLDAAPETEVTVTPEAAVTVITPAAETGPAYTPEPTPTATAA